MFSNTRKYVKAVSKVLRFILSKCRLFYYNCTVFGYHSALPFSTTVYGRILTLDTPCNLSLGRKCRIGDSTYFATGDQSVISIEDEVNINLGCVIVSIDGVKIGARTSIAEYVSIRDQEHNFIVGEGTRDKGFKTSPVSIGRNVWIGRSSYIGPGTVIGDNSIVAANSVVRGVFPAGVLIAGAPASIKRRIGEDVGSN